MSLSKEFYEFLKEYKVIGLAIALVMGLAANQFIKSLVDNIVMPLITPFIPGGEWKVAKLVVWKFSISWGQFLSDLIYFVIIAAVVFIVAKKVFKEDKVAKK